MIREKKDNVLLFIVVLLACFMVSAGVRFQQFETWKKSPDAYFVGDRPMMTTLDAPYWLRLAREYNEGIYRQKDNLHGYPEETEAFREMSVPQKFRDPPLNSSLSSHVSEAKSISYRDVPLLSFLIAYLAPFLNYNYYLTGTLLIPVFASLFILPLGLYFFRIGISVSGLMGGLIGTFAGGYYMRSSIGRIDTDMLNLFFPILAAFLILLASLAKTERAVLLGSLCSGLSLFLFQWWYGKEGFALAFFAVLIFSLFVKQFRFRTILLSALLYVLSVHPVNFMNGTNSVKGQFENYFFIEESVEVVVDNGKTPASFPNTFTTISEADHAPMNEVFRRIISNTTIDWVGIIAFFALAVFRWRVLIPLAPLLALGLLSFQSSNRFIMYLAPFIGLGLGWLLQIVIEGVFYFWRQKHAESSDKNGIATKGTKIKSGTKKLRQEIVNEGEGSFWSFLYLLVAGKDLRSTKVGTKKYEKDFLLKTHNNLQEHKTIFHKKWLGLTKFTTEVIEVNWWNWARQGSLYLGMGLFFIWISGKTAISFVPGPSIHPKLYATFLEVKNLVPKDSALLTWWDYGYAITDATGLATFHDGGRQRGPRTYFIARSMISHDPEELYDITQYLSTFGNLGIAQNNSSPEHLLKTVRNPQLKPWNPIHLFFTADMTGKFGAISKLGSWDLSKGGSQPRFYQNLACNKFTNDEMFCRGAKFDLKAGKINNQVTLKRLIFMRNGQVLREQKFEHAHGYTLQLLISGQSIVEVQLIDESVFLSNYNQMFLLGRYRKDLFEEVYNAFPFSRLYRVKY
ncbi:hypothetical protein OAK48_00225 [Deltaproteobacteria bacterium]|nr:hypothetical protein [Deltaproteobacteria bacterium]